jgi:signal transduction histidine kinase
MSAELALRKLSPDDPLVPRMKLILNNMDRLDEMIGELLDASRLEAGQSMPLELELCDFDRIIREAIDELGLSYPNCFKVQTKGKCEGYWDENGIRRIVENLLTNAIKYGDENTCATISLSQDKTSVELSVHNFGTPIPPEDVPILFEQYRRLKTSKDKSGWGLGLTMVKGMVAAHKGSITVESDKTKGTTFTVKLPKDARSSVAGQFPHQVEQPNQVEDAPQVSKSETLDENQY